jgi:hypothetical protein
MRASCKAYNKAQKTTTITIKPLVPYERDGTNDNSI